MKNFLPLLLFLFISLSAQAQLDSQPAKEKAAKRHGRPDIPGTFVLDFGFNQPIGGTPDNFDLAFIGTKTFNVYYQYDFRIAKSNFSFTPGLGLSLERFKFKNFYILDYATGSQDQRLAMFSPVDAGYPGIKKSQFIMNYLDVPIEIKYSSKPDDPNRSFKASLGFRAGVLYDSFTKVKYKENGETKKIKDKQNYNLTQFRYGVYAKIGFGNVHLFGYYNITPVFEAGKGFYENNVAQDFNTITFGISLSSF
ncbi:MAG: hypothetical protein JNM57_08815 [Cyclobacteriaceae bacterium]|nr:hypothetical protein [Cyclobacteriaceae bacterium]